MVDSNKLRGCLKEHQITQEEISKKIGITPKTFTSRLRSGVFKTDEIDAIINVLGIDKDRAIEIFFARKVT